MNSKVAENVVPEWNVFVEDVNGQCIKVYDIFTHKKFYQDCLKNYEENKNDQVNFRKQLRKDLMYYFWSKCEWEVVLTCWPPAKADRFKDEKIDVFDQVSLNWDVFVDYVWENLSV